MGGAAVVGVIIRFVYVLTARRLAPFGDAETYYLLGQGLSEGKGYVRPFELALFGDVVSTAEFPRSGLRCSQSSTCWALTRGRASGCRDR